MKRTGLFLIGILFLVSGMSAQIQLKGQVLDDQTNEPLAGVQVFLDGTTIGTVTDGEGYFKLLVSTSINTSLVISYMGYESIEVAKPFEGLPDRFSLVEKKIGLGEVEVKGKTLFTRDYKMKMFKQFFLGDTRAGSSCRILNEDDIHLVYVKENQTFYAYADVPIEIENKYLRYRINWNLIEFRVEYNKDVTLLNEHADYISITGTCTFEDLSPNDVLIKKRRDEVYKTSSARFFNLLAHGEIEGSNFVVGWNRDGKISDASQLFTVTPVEPHSLNKLVRISIPVNDSKGKTDNDKVNLIAMNDLNTKKVSNLIDDPDFVDDIDDAGEPYSDFQVSLSVYNASRRMVKESTYGTANKGGRVADYKQDYRNASEMTFLVNSFCVDAYGNTDLEKNLYVNGSMGRLRVGDLLPLNYVPDRKLEANMRNEIQGLAEDQITVFDKDQHEVKEGTFVSGQKKTSVW